MARGWRRGAGRGRFRRYVPVARRRRAAELEAQRARKRGRELDGVLASSRSIARTPWGRAWCDHIESFRDYDNRLPRGRTYVRNGSVIHLEIDTGAIRSLVMGSELYEQSVLIEPCKPADWKRLVKRCSGSIGSLIELLEGRISSEVMATMTAEKAALLPDLRHVRMTCSCPDWASLCKHLAAVLYGVGARLDERPQLLFTLRGTDPEDLVTRAELPGSTPARRADVPTVEGDLASVFGIELADDVDASSPPPRSVRAASRRKPKTRSRSSATVTRAQLLNAGVPAGTIGAWLSSGTLRHTAQRGAYRHTRESRKRLAAYGQ